MFQKQHRVGNGPSTAAIQDGSQVRAGGAEPQPLSGHHRCLQSEFESAIYPRSGPWTAAMDKFG
jgi:hypothetical protein